MISIRYYLLFFVFCIPVETFMNACGGGDWDSESTYYNLYDQLLIGDKSLSPFLLTYSNSFFGEQYDDKITTGDENIAAWKKFGSDDKQLSAYSDDQWNDVVYKVLPADLSQYNPTTKKAKAAIDYLGFAKALEPYATAQGYEWEGHRGEKPDAVTYQKLVAEGIKGYKKAGYKELQLRYGYQLVRLAHYYGENEQALSFFDKYVAAVGLEDILYYYALEQKAGALTNLGRNAEASYWFSRVFDHSTTDKKKSAYLSVKLQNEHNWNGALAYCKKDSDKAALYAMRGYNAFNDEMAEVANIIAVDPNSRYAELLAIRYLNKVERAIQTPVWYYGQEGNDTSFMNPSPALLNELAKAENVAAGLLTQTTLKRKAFWQVYSAQLAFLRRDIPKVNALLDQVQTTDAGMLKQIGRTRFNAFLADLKTLGPAEEQKIHDYLKAHTEDKDYIYEVVGHLYKMNGQDAKAFRVHNTIPDLYANPNTTIVNDLIRAYENKEPFIFVTDAKDISTPKEILAALYDLKGTYYWRLANYKEALAWFKKVPDDYEAVHYQYNYDSGTAQYVKTQYASLDFNGYSDISRLLFSNRINMRFDLPAKTVFSDTVVLDKAFAFIPAKMNKKKVVEVLLQLEALAKEKTETGARANYLLGNYYQNIGALGYYRNLPFYETTNYWQSDLYASWTKNTTSEAVKERYNYTYFGYTRMIVDNSARTLQYFKKAVAYSTNTEFRAKATFMIASCERDAYFGTDYKTWYNMIRERDNKLFHYFDVLNDEYSQTKFYKEALSKCKYFDYYTRGEI